MGSLFGKTEQTASVPAHVTKLGQDAASLVDRRNELGYVPYYGPETAGFTGQQMAAMQGANQQASALGLQTAPMQLPTATDYGGGIVGHDSAGLMEANLAKLQEANPELYAALMALKGGPQQTQAQQLQGAGASPYPYQRPDGSGGSAGVSGGGGGGGLAGLGGIGGAIGGFIGDAFDGGGFGKSGDTFSGGGRVSNIGNAFGGPSAFGRK